MATEPASGSGPPEEDAGGRPDLLPLLGDIRASRPYLLSHSPLRAAARRILSMLALAALDVAGLALGLYAALGLREYYKGHSSPLWGVLWQAEADWLPFLVLVTLLVFWRNGLYAARELRGGVGRIVASLLVVAVATLAFGLGTGHEFGTFGVFPTAVVLIALLVGLLRASYESFTQSVLRVAGIRRRALLVGEGERLADLHAALGAARAGIEYEFLGAVSSKPAGGGLPVLGRLSALPRILDAYDVDELIVTDDDLSERDLLDAVEQAHRRGVKVRIAPRTHELLIERGEYVPGQGVPLFELRPPAFAGGDWVSKRAFDFVVSTFAILVGAPLWLAVAAAIKLSSRGPVLYSDRRVGVGEVPFAMLKFRTMVAGAAALQPELEARNEAGGPLFKIRDDPRITRVGRFLRRYSLDEMPQVLNVLRGEMSLVGPRPLPLRDYEQLDAWHRKRYLVLPGMTGLWQVNGRSELGFDDLVRLDFYYVENWSIWLDISILAKTVPAVLARRGAY